MIISWICAIIAIEAFVEIIVEAKVFLGLRNCLKKRNSFLGELFTCGYCFSVWVAVPFVFLVPGVILNPGVFDWIPNIVVVAGDWFCKWMILHRCSNILHEGISRWLNRAPFVMVLQKVETRDLNPEINNIEEGDINGPRQDKHDSSANGSS